MIINFQAKSQETRPDTTQVTVDSARIDRTSVLNRKDTLDPKAIQAWDSVLALVQADTVASDSLKKPPVGDIKTTVHYISSDSITLNMLTQDVKMFGDAQINYNPISISAEIMNCCFF